ncbi:MAG: hypothetical protein WD850_02265 [Candidatus Spechtbacterales bacterium]
MDAPQKLHELMRVEERVLVELDEQMQKATGVADAIEQVERDVAGRISDRLATLGLPATASAKSIYQALFAQLERNENELYTIIGVSRKDFDFEKVAQAAREIATEDEGFFLKKEYAEKILRKHPPQQTIGYLNYGGVDELLEKEDVGEVFSALRFLESDEWMHETFRVAYADFTQDDFEQRPIELRVLGQQWADVAQKFVAKKHHNVSHLKEFGVIFLNPISETEPGKFLRDFALLLHYFHEIHFYSELFKQYADSPDFAQRLTSFLRGDVLEKTGITSGEWLIVQRYLWKEDPEDDRLFMPRVNPESMHWRKAEKDLVAFGKKRSDSDVEFWNNLDSVGSFFLNARGEHEFMSFDMEDIAMSFVSEQEGEGKRFAYHQQEALWNELFRRYVGEDKMEQLLIENFVQGFIRFS